MLLLYPCASLDQILPENVTQVSITWLKTPMGKKDLHMKLHFLMNKNLWFFNICNVTVGYFFFQHVLICDH